jgi:phosphatidylglycerol lysyltransferase
VTGLTFWLGVFLVLGIGLISIPQAFGVRDWTMPYPLQISLGVFVLCFLAAYLLLLQRRNGKPLRIFGWSLILPSWRMAMIQFALASLDLVLATAALFVLVPDLPAATFPWMLVSYLVAFVSGLLAHAPGGVGVFESVMLLSFAHAGHTSLFAALLMFRLIYYLLPLAIGILLFLGVEAWNLPALNGWRTQWQRTH